jgi:hypothetical protein
MALTARSPTTIDDRKLFNAELPSVVVRHCQQWGILPQLHSAILLAQQIYKPVAAISARIQTDPDSDEQRIIVDVPVDGEVDSVLAREDEFGKQWTRTVRDDDRQQIRVLYYFI